MLTGSLTPLLMWRKCSSSLLPHHSVGPRTCLFWAVMPTNHVSFSYFPTFLLPLFLVFCASTKDKILSPLGFFLAKRFSDCMIRFRCPRIFMTILTIPPFVPHLQSPSHSFILSKSAENSQTAQMKACPSKRPYSPKLVERVSGSKKSTNLITVSLFQPS